MLSRRVATRTSGSKSCIDSATWVATPYSRRISMDAAGRKAEGTVGVIESGAPSRSRTLSVLSACEYQRRLTQSRVIATTGPFCGDPPLHLAFLHDLDYLNPLCLARARRAPVCSADR